MKTAASGATVLTSRATSSRSGPITTARRSAHHLQGFEDVRKHRLSCNLMQNLWFRGFHPGSFPGGEDHGDAASFGGRQGGR